MIGRTGLEPRSAALAVALTLGLGLVSCGGSDGGNDAQSDAPRSDRAQILETVAAYRRAMREGDSRAACAQLAETLRERRVRGLGDAPACPQLLGDLIRLRAVASRPTPPPRVVSVEVRGDEATVQLRQSGHEAYEVEFVKEDGAWRAGVPLDAAGYARPIPGGG